MTAPKKPSLMKKTTLILISLFVVLFSLAGCDYSPARGFTGEVRLSADGATIGVMEWDKTGAKLKIKKVSPAESEWRAVPLPPGTGSFNFSHDSQSVLVTYLIGESGVLAKFTLADVTKLVEIFRSDLGLAFPTEISPENYLVQAVNRITPNGYPIHKWKNIAPHRTVVNVSDEFGPPYSGTNLVRNTGFFIVTEDATATDRVRSYALPNGSAPDVAQYLAAETTRLNCDRTLTNCLQLNRFTEAHRFFFKLVRLYRSEKCELPGFPRWNEQVTMTPSGNHALVVSSKDPQTRPVINVLTFSGSTCTDFVKTTMEF